MKEDNIENELQKIADTIKRLHDKLMSLPYSGNEDKQQSKRILRSAGGLYEVYVTLKKNWDFL